MDEQNRSVAMGRRARCGEEPLGWAYGVRQRKTGRAERRHQGRAPRARWRTEVEDELEEAAAEEDTELEQAMHVQIKPLGKKIWAGKRRPRRRDKDGTQVEENISERRRDLLPERRHKDLSAVGEIFFRHWAMPRVWRISVGEREKMVGIRTAIEF
jgi:hypothetical protein